MGGMMGGGPSEAAGNYWKSDAKKMMIRALDFTVEPRSLIVIRVGSWGIPYDKREDVSVNDETHNQCREVGWALECGDRPGFHASGMPSRLMSWEHSGWPSVRLKTQFDVIRVRSLRWRDGFERFEAPPRVKCSASADRGGPRFGRNREEEPHHRFQQSSDGARYLRRADRRGFHRLPAGIVGPPVERPALAFLLRPDGSVMVHNEADDAANAVRRDIADNYHHELSMSEEVGRSDGDGQWGMMGMGMGGMMGGGGGWEVA